MFPAGGCGERRCCVKEKRIASSSERRNWIFVTRRRRRVAGRNRASWFPVLARRGSKESWEGSDARSLIFHHWELKTERPKTILSRISRRRGRNSEIFDDTVVELSFARIEARRRRLSICVTLRARFEEDNEFTVRVLCRGNQQKCVRRRVRETSGRGC